MRHIVASVFEERLIRTPAVLRTLVAVFGTGPTSLLADIAGAAMAGLVAALAMFAIGRVGGALIAAVVFAVEKPVALGDRIAFRDIEGEIEAVGWFTMRLRTCDGRRVAVAITRFSSEAIVRSRPAATMTVVLYLEANQDLRAIEELVTAAAGSSVHARRGRLSVAVDFEPIGGDHIALRMHVGLHGARPASAIAFETEVNERIVSTLSRHGVRPFDRGIAPAVSRLGTITSRHAARPS